MTTQAAAALDHPAICLTHCPVRARSSREGKKSKKIPAAQFRARADVCAAVGRARRRAVLNTQASPSLMRKTRFLPGETMVLEGDRPEVVALYTYPLSRVHVSPLGPRLTMPEWPTGWWERGTRLPDFCFDFNDVISFSQLPDSVAHQLLSGWVTEMAEYKETFEDLMDALEWPEENHSHNLMPEQPEEAGLSASSPKRLLFAESLRFLLHRMHALTGHLHVGEDVCEAAKMLERCLRNVISQGAAGARRLDEENVRRELDDVMAVLLERVAIVIEWHTSMKPHFHLLGFTGGLPGLYGASDGRHWGSYGA